MKFCFLEPLKTTDSSFLALLMHFAFSINHKLHPLCSLCAWPFMLTFSTTHRIFKMATEQKRGLSHDFSCYLFINRPGIPTVKPGNHVASVMTFFLQFFHVLYCHLAFIWSILNYSCRVVWTCKSHYHPIKPNFRD